jgi:hypothetical protein
MSFTSCVSPDPRYRGETAIAGVVRKDGGPAKGAYVRLLDATRDFVGEIRVNDEGRFTFFVAPGDWLLVILVPGLERTEHPVSLSQGEELDVEVDVPAKISA